MGVPRNFVVMEVQGNLDAEERKKTLKRFSNPCYKKIAHVVMGEPKKEFKALTQKKILKEKQERSDADWKIRKAEKERKKQMEQRQKELEEQRQKELEEQRKKELEQKSEAQDKPNEDAKEDAKNDAGEEAGEEKAKDKAADE